jgi:hypothetical protein
MSFKKNLLMLVLGGWLSTFSQLDAQIRRPGSENDSKPVLPAPPTSSSQPNQNKTVVQTNTSPSNPNQTNNNTGTNNIISPSASNTVSSQTPTGTNKPLTIQKSKKGNFNIEAVVQLGGNGIGIGINEIKGRYFYSDKRNYRVRFSGLFNSDLNDISPDKSTRAEVKYDQQRILIAGGIEEHYQHSNRVNTYLGFEAGGRYEKESTIGINSKDGISFFQGYTYEKSFTESTLFLNGVAGVDYFLNSQFYIGTEIMVGVSNHTTNYSGIKIATADGIESQYGFYSGGGFEAILTYSQGVRIGFKF